MTPKFLIFILLICGFTTAQTIYDFTIPTINGADKPMSVFKDRNILIITLPATTTASDSVLLRNIDSISKAYSGNLSVIAVPALEDGYNASNAGELRSFYNSLLGQQVTITEGMLTRRSASLQHPLFTWLTHLERNTHFDQDETGPGQKFLVNRSGELRAVIGPDAPLTTKLLTRILQ